MTKWCIEHRSIIAILSIFMVLLGGVLYTRMERQENPEVVSPGATIMTIYPGGTPEDIERFIVKPLEDKISEVSHIKLMESYSLDNVGVIVVRLEDISDKDINEAWADLKDKVSETQLPEGALEPNIDTGLTESYGMLFTIGGDQNYEYSDFKKQADAIQEELERINGVAAVDIDGHIPDEIHINLDLLRIVHIV